MPVYEYKCEACNHNFEIEQRMMDDPLTECPECKGSLSKVIGNNVGMSFKGNGFYATDNNKAACQTPSCPASCPKKQNK
jgi:putative FmdB family regulatory protein